MKHAGDTVHCFMFLCETLQWSIHNYNSQDQKSDMLSLVEYCWSHNIQYCTSCLYERIVANCVVAAVQHKEVTANKGLNWSVLELTVLLLSYFVVVELPCAAFLAACTQICMPGKQMQKLVWGGWQNSIWETVQISAFFKAWPSPAAVVEETQSDWMLGLFFVSFLLGEGAV